MKKETEKTTISRSLKVKLFLSLEDKKLHQPILNSIRKYRAVARKLFTASTMAEMAGATITTKDDSLTIKPDTEATRLILANAFDKDGKAHLYQLRDFVREDLAPEWLSFVWDSLRTDVSSRLHAPDPEMLKNDKKISRNWLVLQGARGIGRFMHIGIGFPIATGRPKMDTHKLTLKWDTGIGAVPFTIPKLDGSSYYIWKNIRDGIKDWKPGTVYLNEKDGELFACITYSCPMRKEEIDISKALVVEFTDDINAFITVRGQKTFSGDVVSAHEAIGWLAELKKIADRYELRKSATGNPHKKWGSPSSHAAIIKRTNALTARRKNGSKDRNHLWTRRIVEHAIRNNCGTVSLVNLPKGELFGHPWNWHDFKSFLEYKMTEIGGHVV